MGAIGTELHSQLPALDVFFKVILAWDFYLDVRDDRHVDVDHELSVLRKSMLGVQELMMVFTSDFLDPAETTRDPASPHASDVQKNVIRVQPLPFTFSSDHDYIARFLPLFFLETKQMIHRAKEMELGDPQLVTQVQAEERSGFVVLMLTRAMSTGVTVQSNDLCLLYMNNCNSLPATAQTDAPHLNACDSDILVPEHPSESHPVHMLAIVENSVKDHISLKLVFPKVEAIDTASVRRFNGVAQFMSHHRQTWCLARIMGLSTIIREYQALMSFGDLLLKDDILFDKVDPVARMTKSLADLREKKKQLAALPLAQRKQSMRHIVGLEKKYTLRLECAHMLATKRKHDRLEISKELHKVLRQSYNDSQMDALQECLKTSGITLIQGPPGTGKTTTIVGILSMMLNAKIEGFAVDRKAPLESGAEPPVTRLRRASPETERSEQTEQVCGAHDALLSSMASPCPRTEQLFQQSQPWIYDQHYVPWYDSADLVSEDLEVFVEKKANETDAIVHLTNVHLDTQPRRVLVCAPSNAAIDEILKRLVRDPLKGGGLLDAGGERYTPAVIRVGPNVHRDLLQYSLETRANNRFQALGNFSLLKRETIKSALLTECSIVCSTLSICGSWELTTLGVTFDTVVIDEASQGVELATLIPLKFGCRRLILVGDPKQLPATVFSRLAIENHYDQSLFQRLERAGHKVNMLSLQYRMHPSISAFPSQMFYDGQLADAPGIEAVVKPPIPWYSIPLFSPMVFYSLNSKEMSNESASWFNREEAMFVTQIVDLLRLIFQCIPGYEANWYEKVAVISPYAEQVRVVRKLLKAQLQVASHQPCPIDVQTVDGFQGREKDFVIFTAVRANQMDPGQQENERKAHVGFLADLRRMNVALTRARCNIWVVGNGHYLSGNPEWAQFWTYAEKNNFQFKVNFHRFPEKGYLKHWLMNYVQRVPTARQLLDMHAPNFLDTLQRDLHALKTTESSALNDLLDDVALSIDVPPSSDHVAVDVVAEDD